MAGGFTAPSILPQYRWQRGGPTRPLIERLLEKCVIIDDHWLFTGARDHAGYGLIGLGPESAKKMESVHRIAYKEWVGPIPDGCEVHHECCVRPCFNPSHLEAVTHEENLRRAGQMAIDIDELRRMRALGLSFVRISALTGVSKSHIHRLTRDVRIMGVV
jgi:hypothetical protein